jgi:hypothetical protein
MKEGLCIWRNEINVARTNKGKRNATALANRRTVITNNSSSLGRALHHTHTSITSYHIPFKERPSKHWNRNCLWVENICSMLPVYRSNPARTTQCQAEAASHPQGGKPHGYHPPFHGSGYLETEKYPPQANVGIQACILSSSIVVANYSIPCIYVNARSSLPTNSFPWVPHMPYQPYQPSIPSHLLFENRKGRLRFALAQFDENKHGCGRGIRIGKGRRDDWCRRGEVEGCCRPDRSKVWSFCCLQLQRKRKR